MKAIVPAWRAHSLSQNWFNDFDQIFEKFFDETAQANNLKLACDIDETEKFLLFSLDLPGLDDNDFSIEVKDSILTLQGERRKQTLDEKGQNYVGRQFGRFSHSFRLPKTVDVEKIEADYSQGVLKILLPKLEQAQPKKIEVKPKKGHFLSQLLGTKESV